MRMGQSDWAELPGGMGIPGKTWRTLQAFSLGREKEEGEERFWEVFLQL